MTSEENAGKQEKSENVGIELGDRVIVIGGKLDLTRGYIYYLDPTDRIRIRADGVSDRLIEIKLIEDEDGYFDFDPELGIERLYLISKRADKSFVAQINAHKDYLADTFGMNGEPGLTYRIVDLNEELDTIVLEDDTEGRHSIEFIYGIPLDLPFSVLRPREPPALIKEGEDEVMAEPVNEENDGFEDISFEQPQEEAEEDSGYTIVDIAASKRPYPDSMQREDAIQDFLSQYSLQAQMNPKKKQGVRKLVEQCMLLRNEIVKYSSTGEPAGQVSTSFQTIAELLEKVDVPLARPVLDSKRTVYLDLDPFSPNPKELPGVKLDLQYLHSILSESNNYLNTQLGGVTEQATALDALPALFLTLDTFFKQYMRTWVSDGAAEETIAFRGDKEFLRAPVSKEGDDTPVDALRRLDTDALGNPLPRKDIQARPSDVTKVELSLLKGLGPRYLRTKAGAALRKVESGDEGVVTNQLLFPKATEGDLGSIRSGSFAKDMALSHAPRKSLKDILAMYGGIPEEATAGGILSLGIDGNTSGNIAIDDWLKTQPFKITGLGDAVLELKNMGLTQKELSVDQQAVLVEKIQQIRALIREHIKVEREKSAAALDALRLESAPFLQGEAFEELMAILTTEPLLAARSKEIISMIPAYKDSDIALFAGLSTTMYDLLTTAMAGIPSTLARERNRRVRDQFLEALKQAMMKAQKKLDSGVLPTPINCIHVNDLAIIRKTADDETRMKLLSKFLARYKHKVVDNWVMCSEGDHPLMCYHEALLLEEYKHPREKETIHKELLLNFSGGVFHGGYMCKNCGQMIQNLDFDSGMEFDDEGRPMAGRGAIIDRDALAEEELMEAIGAPSASNEDILKRFDTETQKLIYVAAHEIFQQVGIYADMDDYMRIIKRVESEILQQPSREQYARSVKGKRDATDYDILISRLIVAGTAAHVLIEIQTHVPEFVPRYKLPGCRASFSGFPFGAEKDTSGLEYMACVVSSVKRTEAPWGLTGFQTVSSEKARQEKVMGGILKMATDAVKTAMVQQLFAAKRAYLERTYGAAVLEDRIPETIPPRFHPIPYHISTEEATAAVVIPEAASETELARAWIQTAHHIARKNGTFVKGSPFSETSCCFGSISKPQDFWQSTDADGAGKMPALPKKRGPIGQVGSQVMVHFKPRPLSRLLADPPQELFYRVFLRVCYDGPRKGLPHEPGYTNICPHCGFVFPENPYVATPFPPLSSDGGKAKAMMKEWQADVNAIVERGKAALEAQKVVVTKAAFEDVLDASHRAYQVVIPEKVEPRVGLQLLGELLEIQPPPFEGWREIMTQTIQRVSTLPPKADRATVAEAYGPLSGRMVEQYEVLQRKLGMSTAGIIKGLLTESSVGQIAESLRSYLLIPFTRLLVGFRNESLFIQTSYKLPRPTLDAIKKALTIHLDYLTPMRRYVTGYTAMKMEHVQRQLQVMLPFFQNRLRPNLVPGGAEGLPYIYGSMVLGCLVDFLSPNVQPPAGQLSLAAAAAAGGSVDSTTRMPLEILDRCLKRLQFEGLKLTEEQIRDMVAQRAEDEKLTFISQMDRLTPDQKKMSLQMQRLGLGEWAKGGTKSIYTLDPELLEREKARREEMGIVDFQDDPAAAGGFGGGYDEGYGGGGAGAEGGYDVDQMAADDY